MDPEKGPRAKSSSHSDPKLESDDDLVSKGISGIRYLVGLQLFSRLITFVMNQLVLRSISPSTLGIVEIQLELLLSTILFLSREGFRVALLRLKATESVASDTKSHITQKTENRGSTESQQHKTLALPEQEVFNISIVPVLIGIPLTLAVSTGYYLNQLWYNPDQDQPPLFGLTITLYGLAATLELISEPLYILSQNRMLFKLRAQSEGLAIFGRCLTTLIGVKIGDMISSGESNTLALVSFALARLTFSIALIATYLVYYINAEGGWTIFKQKFQLRKIDRTSQSYYFEPSIFRLSISFIKQSFLKHILTEGDKIVMPWVCSRDEQGIYAAAINYGSLPARILFQPLEESCRVTLPKLLAQSSENTKQDPTKKEKGMDVPRRLLAVCFKLHILFGSTIIVFGTQYSEILISVLLGKSWSTRLGPALAAYCYYIPIMGINGIMESYVSAIITKDEVSTMNKMMILFSAIYLSAAVVLSGNYFSGVSGWLAANSLNMILRISWCYRLMRRFFASNGSTFPPLAEILPTKVVSILFVIISIALQWIDGFFQNSESLIDKLTRLVPGAIFFVILMAAM
ncbi:Oligosaccharide translocation protein rft1 [Mycoemilia scoparia]|uniref:Man(5)GlcNAc(2)-PP-dolichol translocation protein RFT1 n=1 Tax=Mycoemilia scoparia TaxID=417184 RepID=A0A9W8DVM2_9FUNG|nr:Oligosaccharide translocation protein rft1 [Mycoemilia scoparia]